MIGRFLEFLCTSNNTFQTLKIHFKTMDYMQCSVGLFLCQVLNHKCKLLPSVE